MKAPRKILFKAKRLDNGEWIEGYYFEDYGNHTIISNIPDEDPTSFTKYPIYRVDPTTLSQFTGWKDSHGNKIFENDIVEIVSTSKTSYKYLIWWNREMSMMEAVLLDGISCNGTDYYNHTNKSRDYETFCLMLQDPWGDFKDIKVIGNIFDNPELVEDKINE